MGEIITTEDPDVMHACMVAERLDQEPRPACPHFRSCREVRPYPVKGYCVLAGPQGWLMIPSIEEYRQYCTSPQFCHCCWFASTEEIAGSVEGQQRAGASRKNSWQPPRVERFCPLGTP